MKKTIIITLLALFGGRAFANNASDEDVLFNILKQEVKYYYSHLSQDTIPVSYLSLNATREEKNVITSEEGTASVSKENSSTLFPVIQFNENEYHDTKNRDRFYELPFTNDTVAIKEMVWRALERCYREAKWSLSRLNEQEKEKRVKATPVPLQAEEYLAPFLPHLDVDMDKWRKKTPYLYVRPVFLASRNGNILQTQKGGPLPRITGLTY